MDILFCNIGYGLALKVSPVIIYWKAGKKAFKVCVASLVSLNTILPCCHF